MPFLIDYLPKSACLYVLYLFMCPVTCLVGCGNYVFNDFIPSHSIFTEEELYHIRLWTMTDDYYKMNNAEKKRILASVEKYSGNNYQFARFLCWVLEDDRSLRIKILKQWLNAAKVHGAMPPIEKVLPRIVEITAFDPDAKRRDQRVREFSKIFNSMHTQRWPAIWKKHYVPDPPNHEFDVIQSLVDCGEPLCLTVFSPDLTKVRRSLDQCEHSNWNYIQLGNGTTMPGTLRSPTIYYATWRIDNGLRGEPSLHPPE